MDHTPGTCCGKRLRISQLCPQCTHYDVLYNPASLPLLLQQHPKPDPICGASSHNTLHLVQSMTLTMSDHNSQDKLSPVTTFGRRSWAKSRSGPSCQDLALAVHVYTWPASLGCQITSCRLSNGCLCCGDYHPEICHSMSNPVYISRPLGGKAHTQVHIFHPRPLGKWNILVKTFQNLLLYLTDGVTVHHPDSDGVHTTSLE